METWLQGMDGFFLLHGNAGSSVMLFIFFKEKKWLWLRVGASVLCYFLPAC